MGGKTTPDLVLYSITNEGIKQSNFIQKVLENNFSLKVLPFQATTMDFDEWRAKSLRRDLKEKGQRFTESSRAFSVGVFGNDELSYSVGMDRFLLPEVPIVLVSPAYIKISDGMLPDQVLTTVKAALNHIRIAYKTAGYKTEPNVTVLFPDMIYALSHNFEKHFEEGVYETDFLRGMVLPELRQQGVSGLITLLNHAPSETLEGCISKSYYYGLKRHRGPPLNWVDINPYGSISFNGNIEGGNFIPASIRELVYPYESFFTELTGKKVIIVTPDTGAKEKADINLGKYKFTIINLEKTRFGEGAIDYTKFPDSQKLFDYIQNADLKAGDKLYIVLAEDFLNTGGTGNKANFDVKEMIIEYIDKIYGNNLSQSIEFESDLLVANPRTVDYNNLKLFNLDYVHYLTSHLHPFDRIITPQMEVGYDIAREDNLNGVKTIHQPSRTIEVPHPAQHAYATGIYHMLSMTNSLKI